MVETSVSQEGPRAASSPSPQADGFQIAFVEDDASVRESLTEALQLAGFDIRAFESAELALDHVGQGFRGVVVTDVRLPGMDGLALMRELIHRDPGLPVVLITGHGDVPMAVQAIREGAYDFIEKPFPPRLLVEAVNRAIEERALRIAASGQR
jgi:two-component system C4-dicarboxylate transport response regulator DctD